MKRTVGNVARRSKGLRRLTVVALSVVVAVPAIVVDSTTASAMIKPAKPVAPVVTSRPDPVSAMDTARVEHRRILITGDDTIFTTTYANPNGTYTMSSSFTPVRTRNARGVWVKVSTQIAKEKSRIVPLGSNPLNPRFAASTGSSAPLVSVNPSGLPFSMTPLGVTSAPLNSRRSLVVSNTSVSRPLASRVANSNGRVGSALSVTALLSGSKSSGIGNEVDFAHALRGAAVLETLGASSISQDVVVPSVHAAAGGDWRFLIAAPGYAPRVTTSGIEFLALGMEPLLIPSAFASDGAKNPATHRVSLLLSAGRIKGTWILDASLPLSWLRSPSRVWPVTVDPTVNLGMSTGINYRYDGTTQTVTNGTGVNQGGFEGDQSATQNSIWRSGIKFSVGALTSATHVDSVTIALAVHTGGATACRDGSVYLASAASYAGMKAGTALSSTSGSPLCAGGSSGTLPTSASLVSAVQSLVNGSSVVLGFTGNEASTVSTWKQFLPTLNVTYDTVPTAPTVIGTAPVTCTNATPPTSTAYVSTTMPTLCAYSNDPDPGATLKYQVYVADSSGAVLYSYETPAISPGTDVAYQVPSAAGLADGGSYEWKMDAFNGISYSSSTAWVPFVVDTTAPTDVGIACSTVIPTPPIPAPPVITTSGENILQSQIPSGGMSLSCTFTAYDLNLKQYSYQLNSAGVGSIGVSGSFSTDYPTTVAIPITSTATGLQAISVYPTDMAGNSGTSTVWTLGIGAGMSQPFANADVDRTIPISAISPSGTGGITTAIVCATPALITSSSAPTASPSVNGGCPVSTVPALVNTQNVSWTNLNSYVSLASGGAWSGATVPSPLGSSAGVATPFSSSYENPGAAPSLSLNIAQVIAAGVGGISAPSGLTLAVCFNTSGAIVCTSATNVNVLAHAESNAMATASIGPGNLSLSSGEFTMSGPSAGVQGVDAGSNVSFTSNYSSMTASSDDNSELGPDWTTSLPAQVDLSSSSVKDTTIGGQLPGAIIFSVPGGAQYQFDITKADQISSSNLTLSQALTPVGDALQAGSQATITTTWSGPMGYYDQCVTTIQVSSPDGSTTTYSGSNTYGYNPNPSCSVTESYVMTAETGPTYSSVGSWSSNSSNQPDEIVADTPTPVATSSDPNPQACASSYAVPVQASSLANQMQCRVLSIQYATSTSATVPVRTGTPSNSPGTIYGSFAGHISEVDVTQWDSNAAAGAGAMVRTPVECFAYDIGGYLRETWDPRVGLNEGATPLCSSGPTLATTYIYSATAYNCERWPKTATPAGRKQPHVIVS